MSIEDLPINEFYMYCYRIDMKRNSSTHPINWVTIAEHSNIFKGKDIELPGLPKMKEALKEVLLNKHYEYIVAPQRFKTIKKIKIKAFIHEEYFLPIYCGTLKLNSKGSLFLTGFEKSIDLEYVWIIKEIKE